MNSYLIVDITTGRAYAVIFAKSAKSAKAYWTRKGSCYLPYMGAYEV